VARIRAVAHVHSDWSYDGSWSLAALASAFARRGYQAVLMAEHDRGFDEGRWAAYRNACARASTEATTLVPGIEYSDPDNAVHIPVWGDIPFLGEGLDTNELLRLVESEGGVAVLAHPGRRHVWRLLQPDWLDRLCGVELWNRKYDGYAPNETAAELLRRRRDLIPFVGLDFHTARQFHPLAMTIDADPPATEAAICEALRRRACRPEAMRLPALDIAHGPSMRVLRGAERARRAVAGQLRRRRAASYS
jgi:predicted metal-dependent phosphoesterase TrpH